jgi:hypothetical protein
VAGGVLCLGSLSIGGSSIVSALRWSGDDHPSVEPFFQSFGTPWLAWITATLFMLTSVQSWVFVRNVAPVLANRGGTVRRASAPRSMLVLSMLALATGLGVVIDLCSRSETGLGGSILLDVVLIVDVLTVLAFVQTRLFMRSEDFYGLLL